MRQEGMYKWVSMPLGGGNTYYAICICSKKFSRSRHTFLPISQTVTVIALRMKNISLGWDFNLKICCLSDKVILPEALEGIAEMYRLCQKHGCRTFSNLVTACWSRVSDLICAMWRCSYLEQARQSRPSMPSERKNLVSAVNIDVSATCPSGSSSNQQWKSGDVAI